MHGKIKMHTPIGIDPTSGEKGSYIGDNNQNSNKPYEIGKSEKMKSHLVNKRKDNDIKYAIAWDAPISFNRH